MTLYEVNEYYGKSYKKITKALMYLVETFTFEVDKSCGKYLEVECKDGRGRYFKVNHGISNKYPYNVWWKSNRYENMEVKHFHTQSEVVEYIKSIFA